ncbi:calcium-binding protein [Pimelobacter simplex]|uniref:calcium-binding protein n=1 Tax=Nocardioides simplex TaxID=2045 RepID=UPI00214F6B8B|nr:hypothetical protein [Pimelobacter simplex]UUW90587.1 hypothetical protein M0M43_03595 [Pimelobacter simplex]
MNPYPPAQQGGAPGLVGTTGAGGAGGDGNGVTTGGTAVGGGAGGGAGGGRHGGGGGAGGGSPSGGGGGAGGGGGGGSAYAAPSVTDAELVAAVNDGSVNDGDGQVVITWTRPVVVVPPQAVPLTLTAAPVAATGNRVTLGLTLRGTGAERATIAVTSSQRRLLPAPATRGTGVQRRLVVAPRAGVAGRAQVTVTARVEGRTARLTFWVIAGTARADRLVGTPGTDLIFGRGGDDRLIGKGGDDVLVGGPGRNRLTGGRGADLFIGARKTNVVTDFSAAQGDVRRARLG